MDQKPLNRLVMKRILLFCLICIVHTTGLVAQIDSTQFLLKGFQDGYVFYKDGRQFQVPMNYSLLIKKFLFLDPNDNNNIKEFR